MNFKYDKLFKILEQRGFAKYTFFLNLGLSTQTLNAMLHNQPVSMRTIEKICKNLLKTPGEIMDV